MASHLSFGKWHTLFLAFGVFFSSGFCKEFLGHSFTFFDLLSIDPFVVACSILLVKEIIPSFTSTCWFLRSSHSAYQANDRISIFMGTPSSILYCINQASCSACVSSWGRGSTGLESTTVLSWTCCYCSKLISTALHEESHKDFP